MALLRLNIILQIILSVILITFIVAPANAATLLTLTAETAPGIQQNDQGPCVIGEPSCGSNPEIFPGWTDLPTIGNPSSYGIPSPIESPEYLVSDFRDYLTGDLFDIGVDVNVAKGDGDQTLSYFSMNLVGGPILFEFSDQNGAALTETNAGNGFSDWRFSEFSLEGLNDSDKIYFTLVMPINSGGREQFFVIDTISSVPLPAALPLFASALLAFGLIKKRAIRE
ncbi:hypothetical protein [Sneathiella limimaris]|uniref:hypothetical protein n=1 Tax=Sneathiella limimaris TaxID=1964213 RepID=UPI00146A299C|nr:hypothetical protein [Sneathiella limimaris]